jgi:hypothetical protein
LNLKKKEYTRILEGEKETTAIFFTLHAKKNKLKTYIYRPGSYRLLFYSTIGSDGSRGK